jgi:hypothetical protein
MCMTWTEFKARENSITSVILSKVEVDECKQCDWKNFCDKNMLKHCKRENLNKIR